MTKANASRFFASTATALALFFAIGSAQATPLVQVTTFGTADPLCASESVSCAPDSFFPGGNRSGGSVSWSFAFDTTAFASISTIAMAVTVVGFYQGLPGNIDPKSGQTGDYFAIDGDAYAPFLNMTDGRDTRTFELPANLSAGLHTFSVVAYERNAYGSKLEGWNGVDVATLTVTGVAAPVPEPETYALLLAGLGLIGGIARRRKQK